MKTYNKKCPICGQINENLLLEKTNGWMECTYCKNKVGFLGFEKAVPIYTMKEAAQVFKNVRPINSK